MEATERDRVVNKGWRKGKECARERKGRRNGVRKKDKISEKE